MAETRPILVVIAPYYRKISQALYDGCLQELQDAGYRVEARAVPGALEIPAAIAMAAQSGRYAGYVALGCVIRGETSHYETVANESARGLMQLGLLGIPVGNGILTVEKKSQARTRANPEDKNKGGEAARACLSLIALRDEFGGGTGTSSAGSTSFLPDSTHIQIA